ncbi:MAG: DUF420 domain-containing protein [Planctomycetales bacterium]|nr:DUF420 domain-containing protein [Planctomycetales bacterium]
MVQFLPHVNVSLNGIALALLLVGYIAIRLERQSLHKKLMLAALVVNLLFLISYLTYHAYVPSKKFPTDETMAPIWVRYLYYSLLLSHVLLAAFVPILAIITIARALQGQLERHRRIARWTWPIWLYVSVTGIIVYLMLYQIYVVPDAAG